MTMRERIVAVHLLTEIAPAIPPDAVSARGACDLLKKLIASSHGAADHAPKARKRKRRRRLPPADFTEPTS